MDDLVRTGNLIEAGFWVVFATAIAIGAVGQPRAMRSLGVTACAVSLLFGISDLVEARTGAWWRPWWLLALERPCAWRGLVLCFLKYRQLRVRRVGNCGPFQRVGPQLRALRGSPQAPSSSI